MFINKEAYFNSYYERLSSIPYSFKSNKSKHENYSLFLHGNSKQNQIHFQEKECRTDVVVEIDGTFYEIYFFTDGVVRYEMRMDGFFSFPGLIIVDELTTEVILNAIERLADMGYFNSFTGYTSLPEDVRFLKHWYADVGEFKRTNIDIVKLRG